MFEWQNYEYEEDYEYDHRDCNCGDCLEWRQMMEDKRREEEEIDDEILEYLSEGWS